MARKKIVYVIVEGPSDETALGVALSKVFDKETVYLETTHGDITTRKGVDTSNIFSKIGDMVREYTKRNPYKKADFLKIIHLVDMDGAYIPDDRIVENTDADRPIYSPTDIQTKSRNGIIFRNEQKRKNIDKLCTCSQIWDIPYRVYFMSCNLDHVLYNKLNSSDDEKENDAYRFARKCKENTIDFVNYISKSEFSVMEGYKESWGFIKEELHSLERHTNFGLCFQEGKDGRQ